MPTEKKTTSSSPRRRLLFGVLILTALAPLAYVALLIMEGSRNIPYWDEIDSALSFVVDLERKHGAWETLSHFFALSNEHRMLTSRIIFAVEYWSTGTLNFNLIGWLGNAFLVGACAVLLSNIRGVTRNVCFLFLLCFSVFQLGNYENFLWSGASIDHLQVPFLATAALTLLSRDKRFAFIAACVLAALLTFTLAHGAMVWFSGALLLFWQGRKKECLVFVAAAIVILAAFFWGFKTNPGHEIALFSPLSLLAVLAYWLKLLGSPLAVGPSDDIAPVLGIALLVLSGWMLRPVYRHNKQGIAAVLVFLLLATLAISAGRAGLYLKTDSIPSRYLVLPSLAWAITLFCILDAWGIRQHRLLLAFTLIPSLITFNVLANLKYKDKALSLVEARDRAALRFVRTGVDGPGSIRLHPENGRASAVLKAAKAKKIFSLPAPCIAVALREPVVNPGIRYSIDEVDLSQRFLFVRGWSALPGHSADPGDIHLVLKSQDDFYQFSTVCIARPDVVANSGTKEWKRSGFLLLIPAGALPSGDFEIGVLIRSLSGDYYKMTGRCVTLPAQSSSAAKS